MTGIDLTDAPRAGGTRRAADLIARLAQERSVRAAVEQDLQRVRAQLAALRAALIETQAAAQLAQHCADHDPLTALANLRHFRDRLEAALAQPRPPNRPLAVFFIDLDGFKQINDLHGHGIGNALLQITATRLRHAVRTEDLVGRIGGDEFACLVDGLPSRVQIRHIACKLFGSICAPMQLGEHAFRMRPSIGIALYPDDALNPTALLDSADAAMYSAKRQRTGYTFFDRIAAPCATSPEKQLRRMAP